jgi:hypothetical protein
MLYRALDAALHRAVPDFTFGDPPTDVLMKPLKADPSR